MKHYRVMTGLGIAVWLACHVSGRGDVRLPAVISDNMVLQANRALPVWGTAAPGEVVKVALSPVVPAGWFSRALLRRHTVAGSATAGADGHWILRLTPVRASGTPAVLTVQGSTMKVPLTVTNVAVGEVWLCSGQSNMEFPVARVMGAEKDIASSADPGLRHFTVTKGTSVTPLSACAGKWEIASTKTVPGFTAVGYSYGRELRKALQVPVGLIHSSWGGTPAEAWTSREGLASDPELKEMCERQLAGLAKAEKVTDPKSKPRPQNTATCLYNAMINPLVPYSLAGAIWYQGESNAGRATQYRRLFPTMISDWRRIWGQGDFPFYFCQLANFMAKTNAPAPSFWAELREAQSLTLRLPATGQAVLIDIGEAADIHPRNKQEVGRRLALVALANAYKRPVAFSGPVFKSLALRGNQAVLAFDHVEGGLVAAEVPVTFQPKSLAPETEPLVRNSPASQLEGFAVCGTDKQWVWADAVIEGDHVVVSSPKVATPLAVRYAWANNPTCNLYNQAGLPAVPFRTDDFPAVTATAK